MDGLNTIVIERNIYTNEVKYLWKDDDRNTLSDLSKNNSSPFSRTKPDYKKFSKGILIEIADEVVRAIDEVYNRQGMGIHIELNGTEKDYLAVKKAIERSFSDRHMDCTWNRHMQSSTEVMPKIKSIYHNLFKTFSEYGGKEIIELCDRNDERGWLRYGFNRENVVNEKALYSLCAQAGVYLVRVIEEIKTQADRSIEEVSKLERALEQSQTVAAGMSLKAEEEIDIDKDKLLKIMKRVCKKHTRAAGKEFEDLLKESVEQKYLDENRIKERIRSAKNCIDMYQVDWRKNNLIDQDADMIRRIKGIYKMLVNYFNKDIKQYTDEINSTGIQFGDKSIEVLKTEFLKEVYDSREFTKEQKEIVRQHVFGGESANIAYHPLKLEHQIGEDQFGWKKKSFDEKDVYREYKKKLSKELQNRRKDVFDGNSNIFEKWGDAFFETWNNQDSSTQSDSSQNVERIRKKIAYYQAESKKLIRLLNTFQKGKNDIDEMISFR